MTTLEMNEVQDRSALIRSVQQSLAKVGELYLFEPNDSITRNHLENSVKVVLSYLFKRERIHDYVVRCDILNNPQIPSEMDKCVIKCDVAFKTDEKSEFLFFPIVISSEQAIKP